MQGGGVFRDWGAAQLRRLMEVDKSVRRETDKGSSDVGYSKP